MRRLRRFWFVAVLLVSLVAPAVSASSATLGRQIILTTKIVNGSTIWVDTVSASASGDAQGVELTTNGGRSWRDVTPPGLSRTGGDHWIINFAALNARDAWVARGTTVGTSRGTLLATTDGGATWTPKGPMPEPFCRLQFTSSQDGTCSVLNGAAGSMAVIIYRTSDGGTHWAKIYDDTAEMTGSRTPKGHMSVACDKSLYFSSASRGWATTFCAIADPIIYRTLDGGRVWNQSAAVAPALNRAYGGGFSGDPAIRGANGAISYAGGKNNEVLVYVTHDSGRSFAPVYLPKQFRHWEADVVTPSVWRFATESSILATNDAGATWTTIQSDAKSVVKPNAAGEPTLTSVQFSTAAKGWMTWTYGSGRTLLLRTIDGGRHWSKVVVPGT